MTNEQSLHVFEHDIKQLLDQLSPKDQRKVMASAMRREANKLKRAAQMNVRASGLNTSTRVDKGVYSRVYPKRYGLGFMVSVKPHGAKKGIHRNRYGREKPVLMFAEEGTKPRNVGPRVGGSSAFRKGKYASRKWRDYKRSGHSTGKMPKYGFIEKTEQTETQGIEQRLWTDFERNVAKAADKAINS